MKRVLIVSPLVVFAIGCTPPPIAGDPIAHVKNEEAFDGVRCSAVRPQTEPDLMAWDAGSRSNLKALRSEGIVVVRYEAQGCNVMLELLPNCIVNGSYKYVPYSANEHKVAHNVNELFAQLPLGATRLTGKVKGDRALRTDYMLVGQYRLPATASFGRRDLIGPACDRATHVVSVIHVGGFALVSGERRAMDAAVTVFDAGVGASASADAERIADEGEAQACKAAQIGQMASGACDVPLRIGLLALAEAPSPVAMAPPGSQSDPRPMTPPMTTAQEPKGSAMECAAPKQLDSAGRCISPTEQHGTTGQSGARATTTSTPQRQKPVGRPQESPSPQLPSMQTDDHPPDSILVEWAPPDDKERWRLRGWDKHSRSIDCVLPCSHWLAWKSNFNLELRQLDARDSLRSSETHTSRPVDHDAPYIGPADIKQDILSHRLDANSAIVATPRTKTMEPVLYASVVAPPFLMLVAGVGLLVNQAVNPRTTVEEGVLYGTAFTAIGGAATLALGLYGLVWANWTNGVNIKTRPAVTVSEPPTSARATRMSTLVRFGPIIGELPAGSTFLIGPGFAAGRF